MAVKRKDKKKKEIIKAKNPEREKYNSLLRNILLFIGLVVIVFFAALYIAERGAHFTYKQVDFNIIQEGQLKLYNTQIPIYSSAGKKIQTYNFYLRNDPRTLEKFNFQSDLLNVKKFLVLNYSSDMDCEGYGIIALTNVINLYELIGARIVKDENATCDETGTYMRFDIQKSNETKIEKIGKDCYLLSVNNCEILPVTEKMMVETFVKMKDANAQIISSSGAELDSQ